MAKKEIMVVDDNLATLKQISLFIGGRYDYSLITSGAQALEYCREERPSLALLDIDMPGMDGFETLFRLKQLPLMDGVPMIFLSSNISPETEVKALESGARDFITKPVDPVILLHRIEMHLELAEYETDMENTRRELENNIVLSFADLVESKDSNTGGHVLRTSRCLGRIGARLMAKGLYQEELNPMSLDLMVKATPFHDIGKIGISDVILLKSGPLTEQEYEEVKKHTILGGNFLKGIHNRLPDQAYLGYASVMAEGHHERYDGNGYPYGLEGSDIPFSCRLLSVANVYDACLTDRIYRPGLTHDEAVDVIVEGRGSAFDPTIVDAFLDEAVIFRALNQPQSSLPIATKRYFRMRRSPAGYHARRV
ncbi:MAG: response regulator [Deltaproteobacteria bacterium]|jgi:putative two-component system response regulator|nr:response regulator [Deltaproteobacteria bacterium]